MTVALRTAPVEVLASTSTQDPDAPLFSVAARPEMAALVLAVETELDAARAARPSSANRSAERRARRHYRRSAR